VNCWPYDSPTFLHDEPSTLSYDIVFNKRPYLKDEEKDEQKSQESLMHMRGAIKLKATILNIVDGMESQILIKAIKIYLNNKEYRDDSTTLASYSMFLNLRALHLRRSCMPNFMLKEVNLSTRIRMSSVWISICRCVDYQFTFSMSQT